MLKLFKDLTRPPEPLSPRPSPRPGNTELPGHPSLPRPPSRGRSPGSRRGSLSAPNSPGKRALALGLEDEEDGAGPEGGEEKDEDAKRIRELLEEVETVEEELMGYVNILSQLNVLSCTTSNLRAFRRYKGFRRLLKILTEGFAAKLGGEPSEEERQVIDVQRMEGLRIWFEVLGWALHDRENLRVFEALGGYLSLLRPLRTFTTPDMAISNGPNADSTSTSPGPSTMSQDEEHVQPRRHEPGSRVLAHLLAHILNNDYSVLSLPSSTSEEVDLEALHNQLGDAIISRPRALPLLWSYIWGMPLDAEASPPPHLQASFRGYSGKGKGRASDGYWEQCTSGSYEDVGPEWSRLIDMTFKIILVASKSSIANCLAIRHHLTFLPQFLMDRLYGFEPEKQYEITFPPRDDWFEDHTMHGSRVNDEEVSWTAPKVNLRPTYLALLRSTLEAGVDQGIVWRLFGRVKIDATSNTAVKDPPLDTASSTSKMERDDSAQSDQEAVSRRRSSTVTEQDFALSSDGVVKADSPQTLASVHTTTTISDQDSPLSLDPNKQLEEPPSTPTPAGSKKRARPGRLIIDPAPGPGSGERLDKEVLGLIRHAMRCKWPDLFVFRGMGQGQEPGLELPDMGRAWPVANRGFNYSVWIYINKLNRPITLLHVSQAGQPHPLFQIRILENSQISLLASVHRPKPEPVATATTAAPAGSTTASSEDASAPEEVICSAPDALIAHGQWIHFAVGCRRPKGSEMAEAKIFVNGVRVGSMLIPYPVPAPPSAPTQAPTLNVKPPIAPDAIRLSVGKSWEDKKSGDGEGPGSGTRTSAGVGREEENEFLLGRTLLVEDALPEDLVLLIHRLGPRYAGNFQDSLGKFLTYEAATSINIYLSSQGQSASDKRLFTSSSNSVLVKAIRGGPTIPEENILLSVTAKDCEPADGQDRANRLTCVPLADVCINAAAPHPSRAKQVRHGSLSITGSPASIEPGTIHDLDESVSCVGGGAVVLKMIDLARDSEELATTLGILRDMIKDSWSASEEMERIRGFDLLAAIIRPKMVNMVDATCAKIILSMLGINMDKPANATVHNSAAYRALGLEFELWARASLGVVTLYLQHFEYLLVTSKYARYNILRTFQKAAMVRKLLYALRSSYFDLAVVPVVVDTLRLVLIARWSAEDAIKPVFSYLVSALCQSNTGIYTSMGNSEPPSTQVPAAQILAMIATLAHNRDRLIKLNRSLALHRLLVIFISSNSAPYVIEPCLDILEQCTTTTGLESFQRSFEAEGGFALLARTLGVIWSPHIQARVFSMLVGPGDKDGKALHCPALVSTVLSALDCLLQGASGEDVRLSRRGSMSSMRSVTMTPLTTMADLNGATPSDDSRLEDLLRELTSLYGSNSHFRRAFTGRRVEQMLPAFVDFAAVSSNSSSPSRAKAQRRAAAAWLQAIVDKNKIPHSMINQLKLVIEQLHAPVTTSSTSSNIASSLSRVPSSPRPSSIHMAKSYAGKMSKTPPGTPPLSAGPIPRRRPSADAGSSYFGSGSPFSTPRTKVWDKRTAPTLKRTLTGESVLEGGKDKNAAWKLIIIQTDTQGHSKMTLERKEHWKKLSEVDWPRVAAGLRSENGLWPEDDGPVNWRLDGSEGPLRMRNRLERVKGNIEPLPGKLQRKLRDAIPSVDELSSAVSRINMAPWEDPFALAVSQAAPITEEGSEAPLVDPAGPPRAPSPTDSRIDDEPYVEIEEDKDDKMRRIAKTLQAGDVVEEAHNIVRIIGVDACPGLLILGKKNLYLVDGLVQTSEGEVIDARDAPRDVLTIPGTMVDFAASEQESLRWSYSDIIENNKRAFLFRDVALELYFSDKRNYLVVFKDKRQRQLVVSKLQYKMDQTGGFSRSIIGNFVLDQVARAMEKPEQHPEALTRKWQAREISNFAYLSLLNQHANRTPNDVTQYPVFPWVLSDYTSHILDLTKSSSFRDLSLPMGALTPARREAAVERYTATKDVGEQPFHYGTHYSSSMIVCGFMIRLSPFTEIFLALQGGNFDLADRLFSSVARAWDSASADNRGDVRELIPEFFYSSAWTVNLNHHDFGRKQVSGDTIDNVILPPWALEDPLLFAHRHREALESEYVSRHLHSWIDLTFGWKQRDPSAYNCFHPLSYRGAVDLEGIEDESERAASTAIIHNFGQTPLQIFKSPHPVRYTSGRSTLPFGQNFGVAEQWQLLIRSILPITETTSPIDDVSVPSSAESKPTTYQRHRLSVPGTLLSVNYGFADDSLRAYYPDMSSSAGKVTLIIEGVSVIHAIFVTPTLLVTVSWDSVITVWRMTIKNHGYKKGDVSMQREATLRGHVSRVTCMAASASWSFLVTCSENGNAKIWDMNRLRYTRTIQIPTHDPIKHCSINESDGQIAIATATHLFLYSLNGHPIASTHVAANLAANFDFTSPEADVFSDNDNTEEYTGGISFLKREFLPFGVLFVIGIGREVALYRCVPGVRRFEHEEDVQPWQLIEQGRLARSDDHDGGDCCMVKFIGETLYAAFEPGEGTSKYSLYQWSLPEGAARHVSEALAQTCMAEHCGRHFGLLEPRRFCGGCGGAFCGTHAVHVETLEHRYCGECRTQLAQSQALLTQRRDSAIPASRRGSMAIHSQPGSRRPSFGAHGAHGYAHGVRSAGTGSSSPSRPGSRRPSVSKPTARGTGTGSGTGTSAGSSTAEGTPKDQVSPVTTTSGRSREPTPFLAPPSV